MSTTKDSKERPNGALRQIVWRIINGERVEKTVEHVAHRVIAPLSAEAREANYRRQNGRRPLTVAQRRQLRRKAPRQAAL